MVSPGHVFPDSRHARAAFWCVRARPKVRWIYAVWPVLTPAGVICEIMKDDGTMARMPDLEIFAREHNLKIVTIADLIDYRMQNESLIRRVAEANIPTCYGGDFKVIVYENDVDRYAAYCLG